MVNHRRKPMIATAPATIRPSFHYSGGETIITSDTVMDVGPDKHGAIVVNIATTQGAKGGGGIAVALSPDDALALADTLKQSVLAAARRPVTAVRSDAT
jgi:hypothetical protein